MNLARFHLILAAALASSLSACGIQLGKYTSSGGYSLLEPEFGILAYERGRPFGSSGPDENLLYIVMLCPGLKVHPPLGSSEEMGSFTSSQHCWWSINSGKVDFSYSWNRVFDSVRIVGFSFDRTAGNAFVARRAADGRWSVQQLGTISSTVDISEALRQVQRQIPQDRYIAALSLPYP